MLLPKLEICVKSCCKVFTLTEITDLYSSPENPTGWGGINIDTGDVDTATITITSPTEVVTTVNVLSQLPGSYTVPFDFTDITIVPEDGEWTIVYTIVSGTETYMNTFKVFLSCSVRCCIDKLWVKVLTTIIEDTSSCKCGCSGNKTDLMEKAMFMEALYSAMTSSGSCNNSDARDKILKQLQRLCKLEKCNCK